MHPFIHPLHDPGLLYYGKRCRRICKRSVGVEQRVMSKPSSVYEQKFRSLFVGMNPSRFTDMQAGKLQQVGSASFEARFRVSKLNGDFRVTGRLIQNTNIT